ncbi:reactive intermediate/imine deaminase [Alteribacter lacisalsi]|uniref:Reactive intermediate/imine deaminase n=1 Tax=Alteribacter lacisalsi TaxID=2045244 RepID=A0A2W0H307_9BACI|nr:RidA family protein [Alteribacter lacisalsi]PYZ96184.1 reactive intermediate/imine deaminase [Alteribacter lacisalsi]
MTRKTEPVATANAPGAIGPYSQGITINGLVYTSGQIGLDPETGEMADGVEAQTHQVMKNVEAVLQAGGSSLKHAVKLTIFLQNMDDFAKVNEIYASYLEEPYPSRSAVEVAKLPKGALIEIEAIGVQE